jgi:preprotein translocase subunit Sec61beta
MNYIAAYESGGITLQPQTIVIMGTIVHITKSF